MIVAVITLAVEWGVRYLLGRLPVNDAVVITFAYIISFFINWILGRRFVFRRRPKSKLKEFLYVYGASAMGIVLHFFVMWAVLMFFVPDEIIAKIIATAIVFGYNFLIRKMAIYK